MAQQIQSRFGLLLLAAFATLVLTATAGVAQSKSTPPIKRHTVPEVLLVPIALDGVPAGHGGWILSYRNTLTGLESPEREIQTRQVPLSNHREGANLRSIAWEITRTRNNDCVDWRQTRCQDQIRVLSVPDGFMAVPNQAWIREGAGLRIYIVPVGLS